MNPRFANAYYYRGLAYLRKREYDQTISDYTKAIGINPRFAVAYAERAFAYCHFRREYDKAWEDVHKAQSLGYQVHPEFLKALREASGRER